MAKKRKSKDDLRKIEGIGPKIAKVLAGENVDSFARLAKTSSKKLKDILAKNGLKSHDPSTWCQQARLARDGKSDEFESLKDELHRGRRKEKRVATPRKGVSVERSSIPVVFSGQVGGEYIPGQPFIIERLLTPQEVCDEYETRQNEIDEQFEKANRAIKAFYAKLKKRGDFDSNITGITARYRTKLGHPVSPLTVVIAVNVAKKLSLSELGEIPPIEDCFRGIKVKILEGQFALLNADSNAIFLSGSNPKSALPFTAPVVGGVPVSEPNQSSNFGTMAVVSNTDTDAFGLTAAHVSGGAQVDQISDDGTSRAVGVVSARVPEPPDHSPVINGVQESLDASLLSLQAAVGTTPLVLPPLGEWTRGISHPEFESPTTGNRLPVFFSSRRVRRSDGNYKLLKFGNGSGILMIGRIQDVDNGVFTINGFEYFNNFTIEPLNRNGVFAAGGDSGSLVALEARVDGNHAFVAVGILFAALAHTPSIGLACNMNHVIKALDLESKFSSLLVDDWSRI